MLDGSSELLLLVLRHLAGVDCGHERARVERLGGAVGSDRAAVEDGIRSQSPAAPVARSSIRRDDRTRVRNAADDTTLHDFLWIWRTGQPQSESWKRFLAYRRGAATCWRAGVEHLVSWSDAAQGRTGRAESRQITPCGSRPRLVRSTLGGGLNASWRGASCRAGNALTEWVGTLSTTTVAVTSAAKVVAEASERRPAERARSNRARR